MSKIVNYCGIDSVDATSHDGDDGDDDGDDDDQLLLQPKGFPPPPPPTNVLSRSPDHTVICAKRGR